MEPNGSVLPIASKAAGVMAMRITGGGPAGDGALPAAGAAQTHSHEDHPQ